MKREFPIVSAEVEQVIQNIPIGQFVADADEFAELGPAFLQCGKITGEIKDGVTLCGKPMYHEGGCK